MSSLSSVINTLRHIIDHLQCSACAYMSDGMLYAVIIHEGRRFEVEDENISVVINRLELIKNNI